MKSLPLFNSPPWTVAGYGPRIRELREKRGWSQQELARRSGLTQAGISLYETQGREPETWREWVALAAALDTTPWYLQWGLGPATPRTNAPGKRLRNVVLPFVALTAIAAAPEPLHAQNTQVSTCILCKVRKRRRNAGWAVNFANSADYVKQQKRLLTKGHRVLTVPLSLGSMLNNKPSWRPRPCRQKKTYSKPASMRA